jgi:hypothetical protein
MGVADKFPCGATGDCLGSALAHALRPGRYKGVK